MKLMELLKEVFEEDWIFFIELDKEDLTESMQLLTEGRWEPCGYKDYWQRIDTPRVPHEKKHITIAHKKHINSRDKQVTWNDDCSRKDNKTFDNNFVGMETAKEIARKALGIPKDKLLEVFNIKTSSSNLLIESEGIEKAGLRYVLVKL